MKVYLDVIFMINFIFDLFLLITVKLVLKRNSKFYRLLLGSILGAASLLALFIPMTSLSLFMFKIVISCLMILISFGKKDFFKNIAYLYFTSIVLGGFLYLLNNEFSYRSEGLFFVNNGFSINIIVLVLLSPIILYCYFRQTKFFAIKRVNICNVKFEYHNKIYEYLGYLDTGNQLYDPYKHRPVLLLYDPLFTECQDDKKIYVPYETLDGKGVVKCIIVDRVVIDEEREFKDVLIGLSKDTFKIAKVQMILHPDFFV